MPSRLQARFVVPLGISPDGVEAVTTGLMRALRGIVDNPDAWRRRGQEGRRRAEAQFAWDANVVSRAIDIYRSVVKLHDSTGGENVAERSR